MTYDVFISYSRKDSEVAGRIYDALTEAGITCFIDREGISGGADFPTGKHNRSFKVYSNSSAFDAGFPWR